MITGHVLVCAFLLNQPKTKSIVDSFALAVDRLSPDEWRTLKSYIEHGTFMLEKQP
jgi:hypothetical protein